jgi:leucyl aminopeptidase
MNFELKPIGLVGASTEKCDALIVLVPQDFKARQGRFVVLVAQAIKSV